MKEILIASILVLYINISLPKVKSKSLAYKGIVSYVLDRGQR